MNKMNLVIAALIGLCISCGQQNQPAANAAVVNTTTESFEHGKELFMQNCASCHAIDKELVGPPMKGSLQRWSDKEKLYRFIRNAPEVIEEDKYAKDLWLKYNQTTMMPFPDLTDADIDAIFQYTESVK